MNRLTVGELKEMLEGVSDDCKVFINNGDLDYVIVPIDCSWNARHGNFSGYSQEFIIDADVVESEE